MAKAKDRGEEFLKGILAKIPEAEREAVQKHLLTEDIATEIGNGVLRQDDYGRQTAALKTTREAVEAHKTQLDDWYAQRQADLKELDELRKRGRADDDDDRPPKVDLSGYVKADDVAKRIAEVESQGLWLMKTTTKLAMQHLNDFKEVLDVDKVIEHAREKHLTLDAAYDDFVKPRVDAKRQAETDERIKAAKEEGRLEESRRREAMPYPVGSTEPSTLDGLNPDFQKTNAVALAVDDYYKSRAGRA